MRWDGLFADLEAQLAQAAWREVEAEAAEMTRGESAAVHLADRLRGAVGHQVQLRLGSEVRVEMLISTVGPTWVGGTDRAGALVVPLASVRTVDHRLPSVVPERSAAARSMGLGAVFRTLSRARIPVAVIGQDGRQLAEGTIDRVGADHLDVAVHARDEIRRGRSLRGTTVVAFDAIGHVRSTQAPEV